MSVPDRVLDSEKAESVVCSALLEHVLVSVQIPKKNAPPREYALHQLLFPLVGGVRRFHLYHSCADSGIDIARVKSWHM